MYRHAGLFTAFGLLAAGCGPAELERTEFSIAPSDFVVLPCHAEISSACALAVAGGKRVLLGAPSGADRALSEVDLRQLDAVFLFSLRAADIDGLDTVRNRSWQAGRSGPLQIVGPDGTRAFVDSLNIAFETPDALHIVDHGMTAGGFDAALLDGVELPPNGDWVTPFDTGDFSVKARDLGNGHLQLRLEYETRIDVVSNCEAWQAVAEESDAAPLGCPGSAASDWPLPAPIWYVRRESDF